MDTTLLAPTKAIPGDELKTPEKGIAICLSGGGYRAMLFHVGALWRLQEIGYLNETATAPAANRFGSLAQISSVSGGSIAAGILALAWSRCNTSAADPAVRIAAFKTAVVEPIRALARVNIAGLNEGGVFALLGAIILPGSVYDHVTRTLEEHLFHSATLQDIPDLPRFVINASNLQSGALWRFSKPFIGDWRVGLMKHSTLPLASAIAASAAFPPPLSPAKLQFTQNQYTPGSGGSGANDLQRPPYTTDVELSDGGVYDNLGLETAWKSYQTVLVSNGGKPFQFEENIAIDWLHQSTRVIDVMDNQVASLRKRLLMASFQTSEPSLKRNGCYWGIESDASKYSSPSSLDCRVDKTSKLAAIATDLAFKDDATQERLINWGYAICDRGMRTWVDPTLPVPGGFPYPRSGVG